MNKKESKHLELLRKENESLLAFLKAKFPMFHKSNFFFRDLQYGIRSFLKKKEIEIGYTEADDLAKIIASDYESKGLFIKIRNNAWTLNHPEFVTAKPGDPF